MLIVYTHVCYICTCNITQLIPSWHVFHYFLDRNCVILTVLDHTFNDIIFLLTWKFSHFYLIRLLFSSKWRLRSCFVFLKWLQYLKLLNGSLHHRNKLKLFLHFSITSIHWETTLLNQDHFQLFIQNSRSIHVKLKLHCSYDFCEADVHIKLKKKTTNSII